MLVKTAETDSKTGADGEGRSDERFVDEFTFRSVKDLTSETTVRA